jgi:hypothetical protein
VSRWPWATFAALTLHTWVRWKARGALIEIVALDLLGGGLADGCFIKSVEAFGVCGLYLDCRVGAA